MMLPFTRGSLGSQTCRKLDRRPISRRSRSTGPRSRRLLMEPLEERQLLAVTPSLQDDTTAAFVGDSTADSLYLRADPAGVLEFSETGVDGSYSQDLGGGQTLTITPSSLITVDLAGGNDALVIQLPDSGSIEFEGGDGVDTVDFSGIEGSLAFVTHQDGTVTITDGEYSVNEDGTVSLSGESVTTTASNIENLIGGKGDNTYVFEDGAALAGTIDGGTGGNNTLDYTAYINPVTVDLSSGAATGTVSVGNVHNVTGGSGADDLTGSEEDNILSGGPGDDTIDGWGGSDLLAGDDGNDTLVGPVSDSLWEITGPDAGTLNKTSEFNGIENLLGSADNQDGFVFFTGGSISGTVNGGVSGSDGIIVEDPAEEGPFTVVNPHNSGAGILSLYGQTITYAGMEPIVDTSTAGTVVIHGSVHAEELILEDADAGSTGQMRIQFNSGDVYDVGSVSFLAALTFANPVNTLILKLGRSEDSLTIGAFDPSFTADIEYEGGSGFDTLVSADGSNAWNITGENTGTLNAETTFVGIENLVGGGGQDDFVFADGARVEGTIDGGSGGPNTLDYHLDQGGVTVALGIEADNIDSVIGGAGNDTLYGLYQDSVWSITGAGSGQVVSTDADATVIADVTFSDFENLAGRYGDDSFVFAEGAGVTGTIDGGGGDNTLDYSLYSTTDVTVSLGGSGLQPGAGTVLNIQGIIGGGGDDTLVGPNDDSIWNITGPNSGDVAGVGFTGFENLTGAADNEDGFLFHAGGSVDGVIDGGAGGSDGLAIEDPATPGSLVMVEPSIGGAGTVSVGALFPGDGRTIVYTNLETSFSADNDPVNLTVKTSFLDEEVTLEAGPTSTQLQLRVSSATLPVLFWDADLGAFVDNTQIFDIPSGSLTIDLRGGDDTLTITDIDTLGASLIIDTGGIGANASALRVAGFVAAGLVGAGPLGALLLIDRDDADSVTVSGEVVTGGGDFVVEAEDITVATNSVVSTRRTLTADPESQSNGDSGDMALVGKTIIVNSGAKLLTYDNRDPSVQDSKGIPASIDNQSWLNSEEAEKPWFPGSYYSVETTSSGSGVGLTVNITTDADGNPTASIDTPGTGYADDETITIEDPRGFGGTITVQVDGLLDKGGDIALTAIDHQQTYAYVPSDVLAKIEINGALLEGRNISIRADASNDSIFDGEMSKAEEVGESALDFLANIRPLVGYSKAEAEASIFIGGGSQIQSDANVTLFSKSQSEANFLVLGIGASVAYARSESDAWVKIETGASISAGGDVRVDSFVDNAVSVSALNMVGTTPDFLGQTAGDKAIPAHITFALTEAYSHASTTVGEGATIMADGSVDVRAINNKDLTSSASGGGTFDFIGAGVVVALSDATAEASVNGVVTSTYENVSVLAQAFSDKNVTKAQSKVGDSWFVKLTDYSSTFTPTKLTIDLFKPVLGLAWGKLKGTKAPPENIEDVKTRPRSNAVTEETERLSDKLSKFGGSVAFAWGEHSNSATAKIGGTAVVTAAGDLTVKAEVIDRPDITAASVVGSGTDKDYKAEDNKKEVQKEYYGSIAVSVGNYTNSSTAVIGAGATVDAGKAITVQSETRVPYQTIWGNVRQIGLEYKDLISAIAKEDLSPNSFVTSWALSLAEGTKGGLCGSANVLFVDNNSTALISEGALINQNLDVAGQDVTVKAKNEFNAVNLAGNYSRILEKVKLDSREGLKDQKAGNPPSSGKSAGFGGSYGHFSLTRTTTASIESGALVNADTLLVDAQTTTNNIVLGLSGGGSGTFAVSGAATMVYMDHNTLAKIDDGAEVTADGTVDVTANDDLLNVNFVGGVVQGRSLGFGITAGVNLINRDTKAIIGNQESVLGRGQFAPNTGVNGATCTIDLGYDHGFATGDAVLYSNGGGNSIGGLVDGDTYYVRLVDSKTVKLARSLLEASEDASTNFAIGDVDGAEGVETIDLGYDHGFQTGDAVVYQDGGDEDIGGLTDGQIYYVIRVSDTVVQLAELLDDALADSPVPLDLDLSLGGSGTAHTLRLALDPEVAGGSDHGLAIGFDPSTRVSSEDETIDLGYQHGFSNGQAVVYSHGGGESIGGLENKGTYYVIVEDPTTIRLAESPSKALAGTYIDLDATSAKGTSHGIAAQFRAIPFVDNVADTIRFDGAHGFSDGQAVVYDSGGGAAIGGLTDGDTYYVNSVNAGMLKLARSALEAAEDPITNFSAVDVDGGAESIELGYNHGYRIGDAVIYSNGGAESIGGLIDGQTYYVLESVGTTVTLAETPGGGLLDLTPQGDGTSHSLRLALDPSVATGTGHTLFEPDDVNGWVSSGARRRLRPQTKACSLP